MINLLTNMFQFVVVVVLYQLSVGSYDINMLVNSSSWSSSSSSSSWSSSSSLSLSMCVTLVMISSSFLSFTTTRSTPVIWSTVENLNSLWSLVNHAAKCVFVSQGPYRFHQGWKNARRREISCEIPRVRRAIRLASAVPRSQLKRESDFVVL